MDLLWKLAGILGPIAITALSVIMVLQRRRTKKERLDIEAVLEKILLWYVTSAERENYPGTGALKLAAVMSWIYGAIPEKYKAAFSYDELAAIVEDALRKAKELWKAVPNVLGTEAETVTNAVGFDIPGK